MPRDHIIPRFYLKNFSDDSGKVFINSLNGVSLRNVKSAATVLNYYSEKDVEFSFEQKLNRVESKVSNLVKILAMNPNSKLSDTDKANLFQFIKMTHVRSPRGRTLVREVGAVMKFNGYVEVRDSSSGVPYIIHRDSLVSGVEKTFDFEEIDPQNEFDPYVKSAHSLAFERIIDADPLLYQNFNYEFFSTNHNRLITSDSALTIFSDSSTPKGLVGADQIYLPISSRVGLMCFAKNTDGVGTLGDLPYDFSDFLNNTIKSNARKFLISHPTNREEIENFLIDPDKPELSVEGL